MGGYGTWDIITRYPDRFAAAAPMSGVGDPSKVTLFKNVPIWNFHNTNDKIVPVSGSHEMLAAMKNSGFKVVETLGMSNKKINKKIQKKSHSYLYRKSGRKSWPLGAMVRFC
jgi:predicted peptidase